MRFPILSHFLHCYSHHSFFSFAVAAVLPTSALASSTCRLLPMLHHLNCCPLLRFLDFYLHQIISALKKQRQIIYINEQKQESRVPSPLPFSATATIASTVSPIPDASTTEAMRPFRRLNHCFHKAIALPVLHNRCCICCCRVCHCLLRSVYFSAIFQRWQLSGSCLNQWIKGGFPETAFDCDQCH